MTVTVHGTFLRADDTTPATGRVSFTPHIVAVHNESDPAHVVVQAAVTEVLDAAGSFSVDLIASDDPGWRTDQPMPYLVSVKVDGYTTEYSVLIYGPGPVDLADLTPLAQSPAVGVVPIPGPPGPPGADSTVPGPTGPEGPQGPTGPPGPLTQAQADTLYINVAGDTVTGPLIVAKPAAANHPARLARTPNTTTGDLGLPGYAGSDTGWRNVGSILPAAFTGATCYLKRSSNIVTVSFNMSTGLPNLPGGWTAFLTLPAGFRQTATALHGFLWWNAANTSARGYMDTAGVCNLWGAGAVPSAINLAWMIQCDEAWPASLPGTQVTAPVVWP